MAVADWRPAGLERRTAKDDDLRPPLSDWELQRLVMGQHAARRGLRGHVHFAAEFKKMPIMNNTPKGDPSNT